MVDPGTGQGEGTTEGTEGSLRAGTATSTAFTTQDRQSARSRECVLVAHALAPPGLLGGG